MSTPNSPVQPTSSAPAASSVPTTGTTGTTSDGPAASAGAGGLVSDVELTSSSSPVAATDIATDTDEAAAPGRPARSLRSVLVRTVLPVALVLAVIGGGATYATVAAQDADRTVPTVTWGSLTPAGDDPAADAHRGRTSTPLSKLLLPVPEGYRLGPDVEEYGNDDEISGARAATVLKGAARRELTSKERRVFDRLVDSLGLEGLAARSYASDDNDLVVGIEIVRAKNKRQLRAMYQQRMQYGELTKARKGPKIEGHPQSFCQLAPKDSVVDEDGKATGLDGMLCAAYTGEVLVNFRISGTVPFKKSAATALVKQQLDHIASPGEYV
ncbi:hypothetical protein [Streptomyces sp. NBC_00690]|uniref:hypothetical protein n=1 Tax=Streptomyces sp. NBC_00690 TaxID=2975808 RepID=UPI002E2D7AA5|nr:hypothetical protein [Streptomyces sp. NBC_00690]